MSSALDEDTLRTLDSGRQTLMQTLAAARAELRKAFIAFVIAFLGTVLAMRYYVWEFLQANTESQLESAVASELDLVARTPFDVILIQVKLGLIVGILIGLLVALYLGRKALLQRLDASVPITRVRLYGFVGVAGLLSLGGIAYAYGVFFPLMFKVLAEQAFQAGVKPTYGIVRYTEFLLLLTLSFGLAAQVPLFVGALSYAEIVSYETFRDKWRYAVLGIFVFGAVFSPPDPFTQIMWAIPLLALYAFSLGIAKVVTNVRRSREHDGAVDGTRYRNKALQVLVAAVGSGLITGGVLWFDGGATLATILPEQISVPLVGTYSIPTAVLLLSDPLAQAVRALQVALLVGGGMLLIHLVSILREPVVPRWDEPRTIDLEQLDATGVRQAPETVFADLSETEAVSLARDHMDEEPDKARAILDRWEAVDAATEAPDSDAEDPAETETSEAASSTVSDTAFGMAAAFGDEETDEDDIGGYIYDIQFILGTLRSRVFILFSVFLAVFGGSFGYLYWRGIEDIMRQFTARVPNEQFRPGAGATDPTDIVVALHPVEVLIFIVKFSALLAILAVLPLVLYYAWPAIQQRQLVPGSGDRRGFLLWGVIFGGTILGGAVLGFTIIAPWSISYLVSDALASGMVISFRIRNLLWVIFFLTIGVGLFLAIPLTVLIFHTTGLVPFRSMRIRWKPTVFGIFVAGALFTPGDIITMFALAVPTVIAYLLGLTLLWVITLPRRLLQRGPQAS